MGVERQIPEQEALYFLNLVGQWIRDPQATNEDQGIAFVEQAKTALCKLADDSAERIAQQDATLRDMRLLLNAASHCLRSYQYGNASTELAEGMADRIDQKYGREEYGLDEAQPKGEQGEL